jgi:hypothetical protein
MEPCSHCQPPEEVERCSWCGEEADVFEDGLRCRMCVEEDERREIERGRV